MGANEAMSAIGRGGSSQGPEQVYDTDYYLNQYAKNQQPTQQLNSIWVQEGAYITYGETKPTIG